MAKNGAFTLARATTLIVLASCHGASVDGQKSSDILNSSDEVVFVALAGGSATCGFQASVASQGQNGILEDEAGFEATVVAVTEEDASDEGQPLPGFNQTTPGGARTPGDGPFADPPEPPPVSAASGVMVNESFVYATFTAELLPKNESAQGRGAAKQMQGVFVAFGSVTKQLLTAMVNKKVIITAPVNPLDACGRLEGGTIENALALMKYRPGCSMGKVPGQSAEVGMFGQSKMVLKDTKLSDIFGSEGSDKETTLEVDGMVGLGYVGNNGGLLDDDEFAGGKGLDTIDRTNTARRPFSTLLREVPTAGSVFTAVPYVFEPGLGCATDH